MWKQQDFFSTPISTMPAKYIEGGLLLNLSGNSGLLHLTDLPHFIDERIGIIGLLFGASKTKYSEEIQSSPHMRHGSERYNERTTMSLLSYIAYIYRNSSETAREKLQEIWIPFSTSFTSGSIDSNNAVSELKTIFTYARHVCFIINPTSDKLDIINKAYKESWSTSEVHFFETLEKKLSPDAIPAPFIKQLQFLRKEHNNRPPPTLSQDRERTLPFYDMNRAILDRWSTITYPDSQPIYACVTDPIEAAMRQFYDFLRLNPKPGLVAADFDGTVYRENHKAVGLDGIEYTHYLSVHCAYIIEIAKKYLREYPETFPLYMPDWERDNSNPATSENEWFKEYTRNILFTEFVQERRLNDPTLTGNRTVSHVDIGQTPPQISKSFSLPETPRNATMSETCDMLATIWQGRKASGPPEAYEQVFANHSELKKGEYKPVIAMLDAASRVFHNETAIITLAFPDFVRWFLKKHDFNIPVMGNRAEEENGVFTGKRDISYFHDVPNFNNITRHKFAVDELGKAQVLEHYFHKTGLKPKVFFGNSDGDYEACRYTIRCGGKVVLVNPRGKRLPNVRRMYPDRTIILNLPPVT